MGKGRCRVGPLGGQVGSGGKQGIRVPDWIRCLVSICCLGRWPPRPLALPLKGNMFCRLPLPILRKPQWVIKVPKFCPVSLSRLYPTISTSPCHTASRVQNQTAPHPTTSFHPTSAAREGSALFPAPGPLGPPFRSWDWYCSLSILFNLRVPDA